MRELTPAGVWPKLQDDNIPSISLTKFISNLKSMRCYMHLGPSYRDHTKCDFVKKIVAGLEAHKEFEDMSETFGIFEQNISHLEVQEAR